MCRGGACFSWLGVTDGLWGVGRVLSEIFPEHGGELVGLVVVGGGVGPGVARVKDFGGDMGARLGDLEAEAGVGLVIDIGELTFECGV